MGWASLDNQDAYFYVHEDPYVMLEIYNRI